MLLWQPPNYRPNNQLLIWPSFDTLMSVSTKFEQILMNIVENREFKEIFVNLIRIEGIISKLMRIKNFAYMTS